MKKTLSAFVTLLMIFISCSKDDKSTLEPMPTPPTTTTVINKTVIVGNGYNFKYKVFYQETANTSNRKGLIILAVGDGGTENDGTLNEQCTALAQEGYVAVTTTYRNLDGGLSWEQQGAQFKQDVVYVASLNQYEFGPSMSNTIFGGLSRGGNMTMALILPGQFVGTSPLLGIKAAILQCSGGDNWKGSAVLFPVAWMSNQTDNLMGVTNANDFKIGLQNNANVNIKNLSECLIYNSSGHCADISGNKTFIARKVKEWLP